MNHIYPGQTIYIPLFKDNPTETDVKENIINHGTDKFKSNEISNLSASVLGRMSLLNYEQQNALLDELTHFYNAKRADFNRAHYRKRDSSIPNCSAESAPHQSELLLPGI